MDDMPVPLDPGPGFRRREIRIAARDTMPYVAQDWDDALVVVQQGDVDLCCARGARRRFREGAVLFLQGLALQALHNPGVEDVVLVALSRW